MAFLDEIGGKPTVEKVHTILYSKLLADPWLKHFFVGLERWFLEEQQTDFMTTLFGGPKAYFGKFPMEAHKHMFITEEIFMARHKILEKSLIEGNVSEEHRKRWLDYDMGMKKAIVKGTVSECEQRYASEEVLVVSKPPNY